MLETSNATMDGVKEAAPFRTDGDQGRRAFDHHRGATGSRAQVDADHHVFTQRHRPSFSGIGSPGRLAETGADGGGSGGELLVVGACGFSRPAGDQNEVDEPFVRGSNG